MTATGEYDNLGHQAGAIGIELAISTPGHKEIKVPTLVMLLMGLNWALMVAISVRILMVVGSPSYQPSVKKNKTF